MKEIISTKEAPSAVGPYSQAVKVGNTVYLSGQIGLDPAEGKIVEGGIAAQTRQCLRNIAAILRNLGTDAGAVVKTTVFITNIADFAIVNKEYAEFFTHDCPARSCVSVRDLPLGALVEIEAIVVL
ncbi:MAG: RidA family protein [Desulfovibrio sp.]|nr:RidA family protein [Desulfovibrio sp.]